MVYSLDFKFVLGYNDRFSGCVDDSYRRYPVKHLVALINLVSHILLNAVTVPYRESEIVVF
ncbi:hypothetical protein EZ106_13180 [Escherichia coli]|nr:hypothetical protein AM464_01240 [Escherichia coli]EMZ71260.1 hypothetical protein EC2846750_2048 [Escherichia coli 2846750]ENB27807.1 hypothetical protein ECBCE030MS09_2241 [Escherichia coli BCE030_MS-09]EAA1190639.1 hypothetical protein [Escherichia coli]EAC0244363.1 hypothetical protein [Escherichia coli]